MVYQDCMQEVTLRRFLKGLTNGGLLQGSLELPEISNDGPTKKDQRSDLIPVETGTIMWPEIVLSLISCTECDCLFEKSVCL